MRIYDITVPLSPTCPVYPGDPAIVVTPIAQLAQGDPANVSRLELSSHSGTHLDVPRHFFAQGQTIDTIDIRLLLGEVRVCALPEPRHITAADLRPLQLAGTRRVLFKTQNAALWERHEFVPDYIALTPDAATFLVAMGVQLVGIDYLSIDAFDQADFPVHRTLLGAGVLILEGLDLRAVPEGTYELLALPLLLQHGDGAPIRVLLRTL